jgi:osmotically inducible protein OsmC
MTAIRRAEASWAGDLLTGRGTVTAATSGAFRDLPVTWAARTEASDGRTSPEELIAAAHASCFEMALSGALARGGTPPEHLAVTATVTFDKTDAGWRVVSSALTVVGRVPGLDADGFRAAAEATRDGCPVSVALQGNVALSVEATLEA